MERRNILSLLGLCLRGGHLAVGEEPAEAAARARDVRVLLLASDAAESTCRRCERFARAGDCLWLRIPFTKEELGQSLGRTSVALAAVTDVGLADALLRRLAELDPDAYGAASERMALKVRRAAERRAERAAQEKAARREMARPKAQAAKAPAAKEQPPKSAARPAAEGPPKRRTGPAARPAGSAPKSRRPRPPKDARPKPRAQTRFAHSRPVKKGKGSFRKKREG